MLRKFLVVVALLAVAFGIERLFDRATGEDFIDYRGQRIQLSKKYGDYDDYKNDPDNIHPRETARVQKLVEEAPIARSFADPLAVARAVTDVAFPGYGSGSSGGGRDAELWLMSVEIPRAGRDRYFLFRRKGAGWVLADDFTGAEGISGVREEAGELVYSTPAGKAPLRRKPRE